MRRLRNELGLPPCCDIALTGKTLLTQDKWAVKSKGLAAQQCGVGGRFGVVVPSNLEVSGLIETGPCQNDS
jgi:hypothetical protein